MKVLVAEEATLFRLGFRMTFDQHPDIIHELHEAESLEDALNLIDKHHPDLVVSGLGHDGLGMAKRMRDAGDEGMGVILVMDKPDTTWKALALQANIVVIDRSAPPGDLVRAVRDWSENRIAADPNVLQQAMAMTEKRRPVPPDPFDDLSALQRKVLSLSAGGWEESEIAGEVRRSRADVRKAYREGIERLNKPEDQVLDLLRDKHVLYWRYFSGRLFVLVILGFAVSGGWMSLRDILSRAV
jgi:DNA-binding NarL/FixJ family response regulator